MANRVKIYIHNTDGKVFELTNEKMAIHFASELHNVNWNVLFNRHVGPFDIIIADWNNGTNNYFDRGYTFVQSCLGYDEGKKIVELCRKMLKAAGLLYIAGVFSPIFEIYRLVIGSIKNN